MLSSYSCSNSPRQFLPLGVRSPPRMDSQAQKKQCLRYLHKFQSPCMKQRVEKSLNQMSPKGTNMHSYELKELSRNLSQSLVRIHQIQKELRRQAITQIGKNGTSSLGRYRKKQTSSGDLNGPRDNSVTIVLPKLDSPAKETDHTDSSRATDKKPMRISSSQRRLTDNYFMDVTYKLEMMNGWKAKNILKQKIKQKQFVKPKKVL